LFTAGQTKLSENPDRDTDIGASPILRSLPDGKDILLIGQKSGMCTHRSDKRGEILWETQIGKGGALGGVMWGMAADSTNVYVRFPTSCRASRRTVRDEDRHRRKSLAALANSACKGKVMQRRANGSGDAAAEWCFQGRWTSLARVFKRWTER